MTAKVYRYRIYARWSEQKVTDKTITEDHHIANFAWQALQNKSWGESRPIGLVYSLNGQQIHYINV
jgi:hypothetical protein